MKHKHHIIPRHMGGSDDLSNLVEVTVEEHANLHKQLWEDLGYHEDYIAWQCLSGQITNYEATLAAICLSNQRQKGKKRKPCSDERKAKQSIAMKGRKPWNAGLTKDDERVAKYTSNRPKHSMETKEKMAKAKLGKKHSEETKQKLREATLERYRSIL